MGHLIMLALGEWARRWGRREEKKERPLLRGDLGLLLLSKNLFKITRLRLKWN